MFNLKDTALWNAWNNYKGMSKATAKKEFVKLAETICSRNKIEVDYYKYI